ncbi:MAG: DUF86 domain-containing protein [Phycisphaerae bacterium]|nr:DUF86 domain-containing protein [Phycisphaerae bacterium]
MPPRDWKMRIRDILDSVEVIREYTAGMGFETFSGDRKTIDAVVRNMTIIGEAANNVPVEVTDAHPEIPWRLMRDFRNVVVHVYFGVDVNIVWDTTQNNLPPLVKPLEKLLEQEK